MNSEYSKDLSEEEKEAVENAISGVYNCKSEKEAYAFATSTNLAVLIKLEKQIREQNKIFSDLIRLVAEEINKLK